MTSLTFARAIAGAAILLWGQLVCAQDLVISNARIIVGTGQVIEKGALVVHAGRIASIVDGPAPSSVKGTVIDAAGMTLIAGYIDGHRHILARPGPLGAAVDVDDFFKDRAAKEMEQLLEAGITTVQSGGDNPGAILKLRTMVNEGQIKGPRIIASGPVPTWTMKTEEEARAAVDRVFKSGADSIAEVPYPFPQKLFSCTGSCPPLPVPTDQETRMLAAALDEARTLGIPFQVHAVSPETMVAAARIGATRLVHTPSYDWVTDAQAKELVDRGARVSSSAAYATPVFNVFSHDNKPAFRDGTLWPSGITAGVGRGREAGYMPVNGRTLYDNGVDYGFATDTSYLPTASMNQELKTLNLMFSPTDLVRILGQNSADFVDHGKDRGTLEAGKLGDILVLTGNPLDGFWNFLLPVMVIKGGEIMVDKRPQLHSKRVLDPASNP